ncbi:MAG: hypothetical protein RSB91_09550, partial [Clostridia bacterium]
MRRRFFCMLLLALALPACACAQTLAANVTDAIGKLDLGALGSAALQSDWFTGDAASLLKQLASGKAILTGDQVMSWLLAQAAGVFRSSLWRMTRLLVPALLVAAAEQFLDGQSAAGKAARYGGLLMTMGFLVADLREHVALCTQTIAEMAALMQAAFPLLVTLLAAVGGAASSAFYQPAVMAAAGSMTTLVSGVTMPFAVSVAVLTMVGGLSESLRVSKLCRLFRQVADWTLGFGLTVFIGVMTVQGLGAAAVD